MSTRQDEGSAHHKEGQTDVVDLEKGPDIAADPTKAVDLGPVPDGGVPLADVLNRVAAIQAAEEQRKARMVSCTIRGTPVTLGKSTAEVCFAALLVLEDPRVDAVLRAFAVQINDEETGDPLFTPEGGWLPTRGGSLDGGSI